MPPTAVETDGVTTTLVFGERAETVRMRFAVSYLSPEQAARNLAAETPAFDLDALAAGARARWNAVLGQIRVEGGTDDERAVFYTALWRCHERMVDITEEGRYLGFDGKAHDADGVAYYVDDWTWDTWRAAHPLMTILHPKAQGEKLASYVRMAEQNPETGAMREADAWCALPDGRTRVDLEMAPSDALFVVFRRAARGRRGAARPPRPFTACREIAGPWHVRFAPGGGAPEGVRDWPELKPWNESDDPGVRFHSGEAVYEAAFDLTAEEVEGREFRLDLGRVEVIAEVELNGVALGTAWRPPYRLPATAGVRAGRNTLRVRVANTWRNRLLGDRREPTDLEYGGASTLPDWGWIAKAKPGRGVSRFPDWLLKDEPRPSRGRVAVPLWDYYADEDLPEETLALAPSGLLGPVRLDSRAAPSPVSEKSKEEIIR